MDNNRLSELFAIAGREKDYKTVNAEFTAYRDFKIRWLRTDEWIEFQVSDYLSEAPDDVMLDLARTIFARIGGEKRRYGDEVCDWLTSMDFVRKNQPVFLRRTRGLSEDTRGEVRDLADSYQRLIDMGLVERDPQLVLLWRNSRRMESYGYASVLMRVVTMSTKLDASEVPDDVMDYCLYSELSYITVGFAKFGEERRKAHAELVRRFPGREAVLERMRRLGLRE